MHTHIQTNKNGVLFSFLHTLPGHFDTKMQAKSKPEIHIVFQAWRTVLLQMALTFLPVRIFFFFVDSSWTARDAAVQKIEAIIKEQFSVEMKNKEHEIEVIDQVYRFQAQYSVGRVTVTLLHNGTFIVSPLFIALDWSKKNDG